MCDGGWDVGETPRSGNRLLRCGGVNGISLSLLLSQNPVGKWNRSIVVNNRTTGGKCSCCDVNVDGFLIG